MSALLAFIVGVLFWQLIVTIVAIFSPNEDSIIKVAYGIPGILCQLVDKFICQCKLIYVKKHYLTCMVFNKEKYMGYGVVIKKKDLHKYYMPGENDCYIKLTNHEIRSMPYYFIGKIKDGWRTQKDEWFTQSWINEHVKKQI